jgi:hypothetical protein
VRSVHVKRTTTWCLHKFPCNAHSHVQQTYLVKRSGTLYVIFRCCWFCTIYAWLVSFESSSHGWHGCERSMWPSQHLIS